MENLKEKIDKYLDVCYTLIEGKVTKCYDLEEIRQTDYLNADLAEEIIKLREQILRLEGNVDAYENVLRDIKVD